MSYQTTEPTTGGSSERSPSEAVGAASSAAVSAAGSVGETAKDEAASVASSAAEQAREIATEAKEQARTVVASATDGARDMVHHTVGELRTQADDQARRMAETVRSTSQQLKALSEGNTEEAGPIGDYVRDGADRLARLAERLESRGWDGVLSDVGRFARRRPGMFLAGAMTAGFFVGRFLRNQGDGASSAPGAHADVRGFAESGADVGLIGATGASSPPAVPAATAPPAQLPTAAPTQPQQISSGASTPAGQ
jgi:vacuolar-type H+-ATPase subunit H